MPATAAPTAVDATPFTTSANPPTTVPPPTVAPPAAQSVVCEFLTAAGGGRDIQAAAIASFSFGNEAKPLQKGITKTIALAQRAQIAEEKRDLNSLANALRKGRRFTKWGDAYSAFYAKYATTCGWPLAS